MGGSRNFHAYVFDGGEEAVSDRSIWGMRRTMWSLGRFSGDILMCCLAGCSVYECGPAVDAGPADCICDEPAVWNGGREEDTL